MKLLHEVLDTMRLSNGAYVASPSKDYSYVWIRDVCYTVLPYLPRPCDRYERAYHALLDLLRRYEWKIDIHTRQKPEYLYEYIHARYTPDLVEIDQPWGHAQNDAIGLFLWGVAQGVYHGKPVLRDKKDREIIEKLVRYLGCVRYWDHADNGMWEENMEIHASSVGACVSGLKAVRLLADVPEEWIHQGERTLQRLLPFESATKEVDLALLSLVYPHQVVSRGMARQILERVSRRLERDRGIIRYEGDRYYHAGTEAQWCFGFPWMGLCWSWLGEQAKVREYSEKTRSILPPDGRLPELYIGGTDQPNGNTPLAWAVAMAMLLLDQAGCEAVSKAG
ncbi:glycoside hydrolase family 15 protein [Desmospora profundinema]|uniref:Phosphorylase kinase alpha/beta subunit n=1 Tax=Desmospora profundinema TaxID=1571184 RepID=A0ABU1IJ05_9BACL|nr:glycoside hydrolase family 15 protein [Desmospora profundinema]MDR6224742.1 phosphorylase kinase alpha/beta subunit [Desmospora profundinema]